MARTAPAAIGVPSAGVAAALTAPSVDGDVVDVGTDLTLVVDNASAGAITVTAQTPLQVDGVEVAEVALSVPAGQVGFLALDPRLFGRDPGSADAGKAYIDYSSVTSVTRAVVAR